LLTYFSKIVECEYLLVGIQQLGDIFSIVHANLHVLAPGGKWCKYCIA